MPASNDSSIGVDRSRDSEPTEAAARHFELDVGKVAPLVASGEVAWPDDLTDAQSAVLTIAVRKFHRLRLIKLIARLIAADMVREQAPEIDHE